MSRSETIWGVVGFLGGCALATISVVVVRRAVRGDGAEHLERMGDRARSAGWLAVCVACPLLIVAVSPLLASTVPLSSPAPSDGRPASVPLATPREPSGALSDAYYGTTLCSATDQPALPHVLATTTCRFDDLAILVRRYEPDWREPLAPRQSERPPAVSGGCRSGLRMIAEDRRWVRDGHSGTYTQFLDFRAVDGQCVIDANVWLVDDREPDIGVTLYSTLVGSPDRPNFTYPMDVLRCLGYVLD